MTFVVIVRVVPGKRDTTSASEIEDLSSDFVEHDSLNSQVESVSTVDSISDLNTEVSSEKKPAIKISTSVGTSPPREIPKLEKPKRTRTISTGTSPPPQNISTQVSKSRYLCTYSF